MSTYNVYLNTLQLKGYLAYEYNPFHNYLTDVKLYRYKNYTFPEGCALNPKNGDILVEKDSKWVDSRGNVINENIITQNTSEVTLFAEAGSLIDLDTNLLNFDLEHPVDITVQPSYDGSVNLILNDDKNIPRLINSRFSVREKGTYEIVDRIGENDTNIYNSNTFDKDTSLYFLYEYNPTINYLGFVKGILPVGLYCFYFTYCDADDNESDYIAESGVIPAFIGGDSDPNSIDGGIKNQNSNKGIRLKLSNLDKSYNYLKITYVRYFADYQQNRVYECKKIYKRYAINSSTLYIQITGNEETEDLDANILNISRFNPKSILTQALCKNMLFFGNIVKNTDNYRELLDCALRIIPSIEPSVINGLDNNYSNTSDSGYYNSLNMYNKVGYHNKEYYRFGVVFIYQNGTLSNVYNVLGGDLKDPNLKENNIALVDRELLFDSKGAVLTRKYIKINDEGWIDKSSIERGGNLNARGVCKIDYGNINDDTILGIKFDIPAEVTNFLKEDLGIRGLFFVRQKCVPNILAQCMILPMDKLLEAPVILYGGNSNTPNYYTECFVSQPKIVTKKASFLGGDIKMNIGGRLVVNDYESRLYKYKYNELSDSDCAISTKAYAGICPDFLLNQPYYNQIFNGARFRLQKVKNIELTKDGRFYKEESSSVDSGSIINNVTISSVTEDVPTVALKDKVYRLEIGEAEESFRFRYAEVDKGTYNAGDSDSLEKVSEATNIVRGKYSPYLAIYSETALDTNALYNIYSEIFANDTLEYQNRMDSSEPFYAISDRYNFENLALITESNTKVITCWKGDCFINWFTYRLNRNFNDPSLPNNDEIIDKETWKENYDVSNTEKWADISRSDLNAVQMGSWITFRLRSYFNYALRSQDHSYVSEEALMGAPRSFYPRSHLMWRGENKMPDSYLYNDAYRATLGFKCYFALQDINYIKDTFSNRILYSAISIQDSFKNNYRYSLSTYFRDYSQEYGSITKLVGFEGYLLVVFEHAIGIAVINERILAGEGDGEPVFINTNNVLPEELTIITDTYGTQWSESVVKSEAGYVYGVDTIAKKIWRVKGLEIELLSDFKVNKFLVDNISLGERETSPIIGLKNVKTHYNNNKKDIMFTFYDDIYKDEEKVWNLCYNELLGEFVTFYSWLPSYSENIDTQFFTFNRDSSKYLSLLNKCNYHILDNTGIVLETPVLEDNNLSTNLHYITKDESIYTVQNEDGTVAIKKSALNSKGQYELEGVKYKLEKDHWRNYKYIDEDQLENGIIKLNPTDGTEAISERFKRLKVILFYLTPYLSDKSESQIISGTSIATNFHTEVIALTLGSIINNPMITTEDKEIASMTTDFYLHGQAGIIDIKETLRPTYWYNEYHPFEFEFIVNDKIGLLKIFTNLVIISNKAEPESFHFEIEGDNYEFSSDKRTMYFRLEATKNLYLNLGSDILYDREFTDVIADAYTYEQYYRGNPAKRDDTGDIITNTDYLDRYSKIDRVYPIESTGLVKQIKSTIFPLYYERVDTYNEIYDLYTQMVGSGYDFKNLSGSEIKWNRDLNLLNIVTHIKNSPIDLVGRLRGNSRYKEGKWNILIPSITFMLKNEGDWINIPDNLKEGPLLNESKLGKIPPIVINSLYVPRNLEKDTLGIEDLPNIYTGRMDYVKDTLSPIEYVDVSEWTYRKEAVIRDKWIKIRVRYSGKNLAVIHSLITLYDISYS